MMSLDEIIQKVKDVILEKYPDIRLAYLFGSYAKNQAQPNSDIDLAILFEYILL